MIIYLLRKMFRLIIGDLPEAQRIEFRRQFNRLLGEIAKAVAEGATRGMVNKSN